MNVDLLLKGGRVIDPANGLDGLYDIAIADGRIVAVGDDIAAEETASVLDVSGMLVVPGIIDMHAHVANTHRRSDLPIDPHLHTFSSGVTTVVDAGTSGWRDFAEFRELIDSAKIRMLAYVNIVGNGMGGVWEHDVPEMRSALAAAMASEHRAVVVGIKTAHYWTQEPFDEAHPAWAAVDLAIEAGELCGMPVMADVVPWLPERSYEQLILEKLRPGDIHTHPFAQHFPVLDAEGQVSACFWKARERGIRFDLGHGAASFWYRHAAPAIEQGFPPDTISTDLHTHNVNGPVFDMQTTMSKLLNLGMPLCEVIARSTVEPAKLIERPELGTLSVGAEADIAVFDLEEGQFSFVDCGKARLVGDRRFACVLTLRAGEAVFNPHGIGLPEWRDAPEAYWKSVVRISG